MSWLDDEVLRSAEDGSLADSLLGLIHVPEAPGCVSMAAVLARAGGPATTRSLVESLTFKVDHRPHLDACVACAARVAVAMGTPAAEALRVLLEAIPRLGSASSQPGASGTYQWALRGHGEAAAPYAAPSRAAEWIHPTSRPQVALSVGDGVVRVTVISAGDGVTLRVETERAKVAVRERQEPRERALTAIVERQVATPGPYTITRVEPTGGEHEVDIYVDVVDRLAP